MINSKAPLGVPHRWDEPGVTFPMRAIAERLASIWIDENGDASSLARAASEHAVSYGLRPVAARRVWNWIRSSEADRHVPPTWFVAWLLRETRMRLVFDGVTMRVVDAEDT